jgi:hypothetical protein
MNIAILSPRLVMTPAGRRMECKIIFRRFAVMWPIVSHPSSPQDLIEAGIAQLDFALTFQLQKLFGPKYCRLLNEAISNASKIHSISGTKMAFEGSEFRQVLHEFPIANVWTRLGNEGIEWKNFLHTPSKALPLIIDEAATVPITCNGVSKQIPFTVPNIVQRRNIFYFSL